MKHKIVQFDVINNSVDVSAQFFVYVDYLKDINLPFYIGKGDYNRAFKDFYRNWKHDNICRKHTVYREIVLAVDVEQEAFDHETKLIATYHTFVYDENASKYASNFTRGGEGITGLRHTDVSKAKMSNSRKIWHQQHPDFHGHMLGKQHSEETKRKQSQALMGRIISELEIQKRKETFNKLGYRFYSELCYDHKIAWLNDKYEIIAIFLSRQHFADFLNTDVHNIKQAHKRSKYSYNNIANCWGVLFRGISHDELKYTPQKSFTMNVSNLENIQIKFDFKTLQLFELTRNKTITGQFNNLRNKTKFSIFDCNHINVYSALGKMSVIEFLTTKTSFSRSKIYSMISNGINTIAGFTFKEIT